MDLMDNTKTSNNLTVLCIPATEEIKQSNIRKFISNNTKSNNNQIEITKDTHFYSSYIKSYGMYEIILFSYDGLKSFVMPEIFYLQNYYKDTLYAPKVTDIFILNSYFCVYQNSKPIIYKEVKNSSDDEIKLYVEQTYKIVIDEIIHISQDDMIKYKQNKIDKDILKHIYPLKQRSYSKIILYFLLSLFALFIYLYQNNTNTILLNSTPINTKLILEQNKINLFKTIYSSKLSPISTLEELFKYLKLNKINIKDISYQNGIITTILTHHDRTKLFDTISISNLDIKFNSLSKHDMSIDIKVSKDLSSNNFDLTNIKDYIVKKDTFSIVKLFEKKAKSLNINLDNINIQKQKLTVSFSANYITMIKLLRYLELHFKIDNLDINQNKVNFDVKTTLDIKYHFNQSSFIKNGDILNPYIKYHIKKYTNLKIKKRTPIYITAILDGEVLIKNRWYKTGDIITHYNYKIIKISDNFIVVRDGANQLTIYIHDA